MKLLEKLNWPSGLMRLTVVLAILFSVQAYRQEVTLYESFNDDGDYHVYRSQVPDSTFLGSHVKRFCLHGLWAFYRKVNYETYGEYWQSNDGQLCRNISIPITSFRYLGANDTELSAATFFPQTTWQGIQTTVTSLAHGNMVATSYVITGTSSWTIYEGSDFDGQHECITPRAPNFIYTNSNLYPGWANYGSVARGCEAHADPNNIPVRPSQNDSSGHW